MTTQEYINHLNIMINKERVKNNLVTVRELLNLVKEIKEKKLDFRL